MDNYLLARRVRKQWFWTIIRQDLGGLLKQDVSNLQTLRAAEYQRKKFRNKRGNHAILNTPCYRVFVEALKKHISLGHFTFFHVFEQASKDLIVL